MQMWKYYLGVGLILGGGLVAPLACPAQAQEPTVSRQTLVRQAKAGDAESLFQLGALYLSGGEVVANEREGTLLLDKAVRAGYPAAFSALGGCYLQGYGVACDGRRAFHLYMQGRELGDPDSSYGLGCCYDYGVGVEPDYERARQYYQEAAQRGSYLGWYGLARLESPERTPWPNKAREREYHQKALETWLQSDLRSFSSRLKESMLQNPQLINEVINKLDPSGQLSLGSEKASGATFYSAYQAYMARYQVERNPFDREAALACGGEAVNLKYLPAQVDLASVLAEGYGKHLEAILLYKSLLKFGHLKVLLALNRYVENYPQMLSAHEKREILKELLNIDYASAYRYQAHYLLQAEGASTAAGRDGERESYLELLEKAADQGDGEAAIELVQALMEGQLAGRWVIQPDVPRAGALLNKILTKLYPLDYSQHDLAAYFCELGNRYYYGRGVEGDQKMAQKAYETGLQVRFTPELGLRLGRLYLEQGAREKGRKLLEQVIKEEPQGPLAPSALRLLEA